MAAWGAAGNEDESREIIAAAMPVTFAGTIGLFAPSTGPSTSAAVLFLSPWGFEEMCTRKFWRILAEDLAEAGIPSLRFDYAGTGDALDVTDAGSSMNLWRQTTLAAANMLASLSGCERIILIGQGIGAAIAADIASHLPSVEGIAFLAPALSGRSYLRELTVLSKMIDESMGLSENQRHTEGVTVAGLTMPSPVVADIRKLNLMDMSRLPAPQCLVLARPGRPGDVDFAAHLERLGANVTQSTYAGYDALVSNPTMAVMPLEAGARITRWAAAIAGKRPAHTPTGKPGPVKSEPLAGDGFRETPLRFGKGDRLFGVLCEPTGPRTGSTAVLLTTAYDRTAGWARSSAAMARSLARTGTASLRFDTANVADSPPLPGAPAQILYSASQRIDTTDAFDLLESRKLLPAFVVGRCSGGYLAFQHAVRDTRCDGMIAVNPYAFYWDETQPVSEAFSFVPRSLDTYGQKFLQLETLKRLYQGRVDARRAALNIVTALMRRVSRLARPLFDAFPFLSREHDAVLRGFQTLRQRKVAVSLIYSAHDVGLEHFRHHFGQNGDGLKSFPNASLIVIPDADHNLTPPHARDIYLREIRKMAQHIGTPEAARVEEHAAGAFRPRKYAGCPAP